MSLNTYRTRPSDYFRSLYGKEMVQAISDVLAKPIYFARDILVKWARYRTKSEMIDPYDYLPKDHWKIGENVDDFDAPIEIVSNKLVVIAAADLLEHFRLPALFPTGLTVYDYRLDSFEDLAQVLSTVNPFWLLELHGCNFNKEIATGDYSASEEDLKYIRSWLANECTTSAPSLLKSLSYPIDRREDGEPRKAWTNRKL